MIKSFIIVSQLGGFLMINRSLGPLYEKLDQAHELLKKVKTSDEKLATANYIGNIYRSLICMGDGDIEIDRYKCFGSKKQYKNFVKKLDIYSDKLLQNFVLNKDFHRQFMGEVLPDVEEEMVDFCALAFPVEESFSERDFFDVFYLFLDSLKLSKVFDEFYQNSHVHSTIIGQDVGNLGFTLHNPMTHESDLFVRDFQFNFSTMITLAHEFGHGVDLKNLNNGVEDYNQYFYLSFYGEVISRLMERLLFRFFLKNGIMTDTVKDKLIDFEDLNHDFLLQSYIFSLLDDSFLLSAGYIDCDSDLIVKKVKKNFLEGADIKSVIERMKNFDLGEAFNYAYGDILSMFLAEEAEKSGFFNDMLSYFLQQRCGPFKEEFFRECGFGPGNYSKLYKNEAKLIKK